MQVLGTAMRHPAFVLTAEQILYRLIRDGTEDFPDHRVRPSAAIARAQSTGSGPLAESIRCLRDKTIIRRAEGFPNSGSKEDGENFPHLNSRSEMKSVNLIQITRVGRPN